MKLTQSCDSIQRFTVEEGRIYNLGQSVRQFKSYAKGRINRSYLHCVFRFIDTLLQLFLIIPPVCFVLSASIFAKTDSYDTVVFEKYNHVLLFDKDAMEKLQANNFTLQRAWIKAKQSVEKDTKNTAVIVQEVLNAPNILAIQGESLEIIATRNRASFIVNPRQLDDVDVPPTKRKYLDSLSGIAGLVSRQYTLANSVLVFNFEIAYMQNDRDNMKKSILQLITLADSMTASGLGSCISLYNSYSHAIKNAIRLKDKYPEFKCSIIDSFLCNALGTLRGLVSSFVVEARNEVNWTLAALEDTDSLDEMVELLLFYTNLLSDNEKFLCLEKGPIYDRESLLREMEQYSQKESVINNLRVSKNQVLAYRDLCSRLVVCPVSMFRSCELPLSSVSPQLCLSNECPLGENEGAEPENRPVSDRKSNKNEGAEEVNPK